MDDKKIYFRLKDENLYEQFSTISYLFDMNKQETMELCIKKAWEILIKEHPELVNLKRIKAKEDI